MPNAHGISALTMRLLQIALAFTVLHHIDHVLRVDHSGWPFRADVSPFTFSLLAYPMILFALFGPARLFWLRWALLAIGTGFTLYAHSMVESPHMQYAMWAQDRSSDPHAAAGMHNMLNTQAPALGVAAMAVSMTLNLLAVAGTLSMLRDGFRRR
jgi:hypothetical protein